MVKLSVTSKLGCKSWSLQAWETCPGSRDSEGDAVPACAGCHARGGNYRFKNVRKVREENRKAWRSDSWVADMVKALAKESYFRWFDSGDLYHPGLVEKIEQVIKQTPHCKHWLPTRAYKVGRTRTILERIKALPNAVVRYSSDSINGEFVPGLHGSTIVPTHEAVQGTTLCKAYAQGGQCLDCRECWNKAVPVIAYPTHGQAMQRLITIGRGKL